MTGPRGARRGHDDQDDRAGGTEGAPREQAGDHREEDRAGEGGPREQLEVAGREAAGVSHAPAAPVAFPVQTPLFHAQQADRYARQTVIRAYEERFGCRLIVMVAPIFPFSVTLFEELIHDADPSKDLHLLLDSPG